MQFLKDITPREYQEEIFKTCKEFNCLIVLPTGIGKTLIALMSVVDRMQKFPKEKIVFLAPTRPLAEQHLYYFKKHLPDLFADMQLFTGKVPAVQRKQIWQTSDIIFSTPQCLGNDLKKNLYDLRNVSLLIEDEAHRCLKNYAYNYVVQKYKEQAVNQRIIGMTASPGSEKSKIKDICKNLNIEKVELRTREDVDVKKYIKKLDFEKIILPFPLQFEEIRQLLLILYNKYVDELKSRHLLFGPINKITLIELQKKLFARSSSGNNNYNILLGISAAASAVKLQHALELLETQTLTSFNTYLKKLLKEASQGKSKGVQRLIKKPEFNQAYIISSELLTKNIEHPKIQKTIELIKEEKTKNPKSKIIIFAQYRETSAIICKELNLKLKDIGVKAKVFIGQSKKSDVHGSTSGLSQKEQKKIIEEFSEGKINVIVSTAIGEEGLDIPEVNAVIFYEPVPSAIRKIQRAGRTARLMKGKLIILITKNTRDEAYYWASFHKEKKMYSAIKSINKDMEDEKLSFNNNEENLSENKADLEENKELNDNEDKTTQKRLEL